MHVVMENSTILSHNMHMNVTEQSEQVLNNNELEVFSEDILLL